MRWHISAVAEIRKMRLSVAALIAQGNKENGGTLRKEGRVRNLYRRGGNEFYTRVYQINMASARSLPACAFNFITLGQS